MYIDSPLHGFVLFVAFLAGVLLTCALVAILRQRRVERRSPSIYWQKLPLGVPVEIAPSRWMVRVARNEAVIGRTPEHALELAALPKWGGS